MAQAGNIVARLQLRVDEFKKGIQDSTKQLTNFSQTTKSIATGAAAAFAAVGTAVTGVAGAAAKLALEQENLHARMQAATGATAAEMREFKDIADNLFANGRGNYQEIYNALTQVKQVLGQTGDEAGKTADQALILAKTFGWDVGESIRAADSVMRSWGVNSTQAFDTFTALAQQAGDKSQDLLDTFWEYSPTLASAGISMETFADAMAAGMEKGAYNFDKIGDALKEFTVRLTDGTAQSSEFNDKLFGSKAAADEFFKGISDGSITADQALGIIGQKLTEIEDPMIRNQLGVAYFGTMWEDLGGDVVLAMANAEGALQNVEGATAKAGQTLDETLGHKIEKIKNQFLLWAKDLGEQFMPKLKEIADTILTNMPQIQAVMTSVFTVVGNILLGIVNVLGSIVGFVIRNKEAFAALGIVIATVVLPPMIGFITNAAVLRAKALVGLITSTFRLIAANYALGISFLVAHGPILLIIAGIAALIAVVVLIIKHWDAIKAKTIEVWNTIQTFLAGVWEAIKAGLQAFLTFVSNLWNTVWNAVKTVFMTIWNGIKDFFISVWNAMWNVVSTVLAVIYAIIATVWEGIKALAEVIWGFIGDYVIGVWNNIKSAATTIWNAIKSFFTTVLNAIKSVFTTVWNAIKSVLTTIWNSIKSVATSVWNGIKSFFTAWLNGVKSIFTSIWNSIKGVLTGIWNGIKGTATSVFNSIKSVITSITNSIRSVVTSIWNGIRGTLSGILNGIRSVVSNVSNSIRNIISNVTNTIRSKVSSAANFMSNTFGNAINKVKGFFGGLWNGIKGALDNVVNGIKSKVRKAKEWLTELNPFKRHSPSLVDNVKAGVKVIKDTYAQVGDIRIAPPQIGNLTTGRIDFEAAFGGDSGGSGSGTTYNAPLVQVENMNVRNDRDVRGISRELYNLQRSHDRAKGGR
ncbi:phage tail tape measure protein [Bacillus andreraoultii]|uniref:phage tail tape measure protein n=1 Tax=Bacillus andreraoultii TaxID=1499685 RepID=UPI00053B4E12|nr:phage tail tape measure protein [Bacillus andreraoultii]